VTLSLGHHEDRAPTHGYGETLKAAMTAFAKSWERGVSGIAAARLLQSFLFSAEAQQIFVDDFAHRSFHAQVKEKPGRTPLSAVKLLKADPVAVLAQTEEIKARYARIFGV
jgi:iron(III) transport system substrate-binding protein